MLLLEKPPLVHRSSRGLEVREGGRQETRPDHRGKFAHRGMSMEYARLVWRRYLADGTDVKTITIL